MNIIDRYKNRLFAELYEIENEIKLWCHVGGEGSYQHRFLELKKCFIDLKIQIINAIFFS